MLRYHKLFLDSDDSDNEGGLGNVEKVVMRPPGHSGKAKKGHLCFDAIYEAGGIFKFVYSVITDWFAGNLGRVDWINEFEYDLFVRPDTCNPRYRLHLGHKSFCNGGSSVDFGSISP